MISINKDPIVKNELLNKEIELNKVRDVINKKIAIRRWVINKAIENKRHY